MLIAICGPQGSGKSTILKRLKERYPVNPYFRFVERKTSRSILEEWNVNLQQVNSDPELTQKFQNEILNRKVNDDQSLGTANRDREVILTERTFADLFTYALIALGKDNNFTDFINDYYNQCLRHQQIYDLVIYLKGGAFQIEHDGVRGSNHHYGRMVDLTMFEFTKQMTRNDRLEVIDVVDLDTRIQIIENYINGLLTNKG